MHSQTDSHEQQHNTQDRPVIQLDVEVLEDRIAPALFSFSSLWTSTSYVQPEFTNPRDPFV